MMPLMLFVLVGLAALAVAMNRLGGDTITAIVQEGVAAQALNAADSGAQYGMSRLLFDATAQSEVDTRCANLNGTTVNFTAEGLTGCTAELRCAVTTAAAGARHYYGLISAARCGAGQLSAERTVSVSTYFD